MPSASTDATVGSLLTKVSFDTALPGFIVAVRGSMSPSSIVSFVRDRATFVGALPTLTVTEADLPLWVSTVMVAVPGFTPLIVPAPDTFATDFLSEV